jgi:hypothetical protein
MHARMEEDGLYPRLLSHEDESVRALAKSFVDELGGIYGAFSHYTKKWPDADAITRDPAGFVQQTREVMKLLAKRMTKESSQLYPLVDELG